MTSSVPIRLKIDMDNENRKGDITFQWPEEKRKYWIVAMFCGTLLLYAARSAVPLCMAAMSSDMNWDKEIDVSVVESASLLSHTQFGFFLCSTVKSISFVAKTMVRFCPIRVELCACTVNSPVSEAIG